MAESERTIEIPESLAKLLVAEDSDFKDASMAPAARELARASLRVLMLVEPPAPNGHEPIERHHRIATEARANGEPPKPKRFMSAKAKKQISVRMKRYWREKRAAAK